MKSKMLANLVKVKGRQEENSNISDSFTLGENQVNIYILDYRILPMAPTLL